MRNPHHSIRYHEITNELEGMMHVFERNRQRAGGYEGTVRNRFTGPRANPYARRSLESITDRTGSPTRQEEGSGADHQMTQRIGTGHNLGSVPTYPTSRSFPETSGSHTTFTEKSVDGGGVNRIDAIEENGPDGGAPPAPSPAPAPAAPAKKAGVDSFVVKWTKNAGAGPTTAKLRLDYTAKFKKDDAHDPALAEFRQNVMTKWEITDGPGKGQKGDTSPMHDDNYSRADDTAGNTKNDVDFVSNDNPGFTVGGLDKDDVIDYSFTAEDLIIDTSDGNKVIARRGPHTGTIKGKDPRTYGGVPTTLSS